MASFLDRELFTARPLSLEISGLTPIGLFLGNGTPALEVAVLSAAQKPQASAIQQAFKTRKNSRATPVLIVVLHPNGATLCGTGGDQPPIFNTQDIPQAERLCMGALSLPDRNAAIRFLADAMPSLETALPGIANEGLLSLHELAQGTRNRSDWLQAGQKAQKALGRSNRDLISALGFASHKLDNLTELLTTEDERTALAVLLNEDEVPEVGATRFNNLSPVSYALTKADKERLPWVVMVQGERVRLYNTKNIGVGRRGRTETYVECQPALLPTENLGLLWLLFSSEALKDGGSISAILDDSARFAAGVADRLRDRVYEIVVPELAMGIANARNITKPSKDDLALTYEMALTVLFRLLFIAYAEDRDLLPYKGNEAYRRRSLKQKAIELAEAASSSAPISAGEHHWTETGLLWRAISVGNQEWGVPPYNGTMFSSEASVSKAGSALAAISLDNASFEVALRGLLLTDTVENQFAPVDFRALSVREFGTIYEGLLESELSLAEQNLTTDKNGTYLPAVAGDAVLVPAGEIYLHNRSGARKSSGSYYTPDFAVEHLLDRALEPALDVHLERMKDLSDAERTEQFFDFRVADIAMGSGHFLVAAIDRIERRFALWLEENPTPGITRELQHLRDTARQHLAELADTLMIEDGQLLRRMIARRCIYGVDLNPITVQLARLSIWIHSFVPGLPLSLLDHNLVHGNALVGVGSLDEIRKKFDEGAGTLFAVDADILLGKAAEPLRKLARLSDASVKDIEAGRTLMEQARLETLETKALCDLITAQPVAKDPRLKEFQFEDWDRLKGDVQKSPALRLARDILEPLNALHFPTAFPEVFLGRTQGFNVILGNPPWEKVKVEEYNFWAHRFPGLRGLTQREFEKKKLALYADRPDLVRTLEEEKLQAQYFRDILHSSPAYTMGAGDPDLYKAFSWRFIGVADSKGAIGVVMPRSLMNAKGSEDFRRNIFAGKRRVEVTTLQNKARWIFDMEPRYTVVLLSINDSFNGTPYLLLGGPFTSMKSYLAGVKAGFPKFTFNEANNWNSSLSLPILPQTGSDEILRQFGKHPWLSRPLRKSDWIAIPNTELHGTSDKWLMDLESEVCPKGSAAVFKGESFDIWDPDRGKYYAWATVSTIESHLFEKRKRAHTRKVQGPFSGFSAEQIDDIETLPSRRSRIAFRDITRATDSRTVRAALIPPNAYLTHKAPYLLFPVGDEKAEAYLLGCLSSLIVDWYSRLFVETNLTYFILNSIPIPRPERTNMMWQRVVGLAGRLASSDDRFANWAAAVGVDHGPLDPDDKLDKIYELDAVVAHLYGLSEPQLIHIFETFHEGWDCEHRLKAVLDHFHAWAATA